MRLFISYSTHDRDIVHPVYEVLGQKLAWIDKVEIDIGDLVLQKVEGAIRQASDFVLFWSESSSQSPWVNLEIHMGFVRVLEQQGCKFRVIKLDATPLPLYLQVMLYLDVSNDLSGATDVIIKKLLADASQPPRVVRKSFIDRHDDLKRIELLVDQGNTAAVFVHGLYGIGKRSLVSKAVNDLFAPSDIVGITVKPGTGWVELALQLCALANIEAPSSSESLDQVKEKARLALESIHATGAIIAFYESQNWVEEDGSPMDILDSLIGWLAKMPAALSRPVLFTTTRAPFFSFEQQRSVQLVRLAGLGLLDLAVIIRQWLEIELGTFALDKQKLERIAEDLAGYPLGARLAAGLIARHGAEYVLVHPEKIVELKVDIAKDLLAHARVGENTTSVLQTLAAIDVPVSSGLVGKILHLASPELVAAVNEALSYGLVTMDGLNLQEHPLVRDFYWRRLSLNQGYSEIIQSLAHESHNFLQSLPLGSFEYVTWLPVVLRLNALAGNFDEVAKMRRDLTQSLLAAAVQIYNRQKTKQNLQLAEKYIDFVLDTVPVHWEARLFKARCRYQLGDLAGARPILEQMLKERPKSVTVLHSLGRLAMKGQNYPEALDWFSAALELRSWYVPAWRDGAECYLRLGDLTNAQGFVEKAKRLNPADPFVINIESLVLEHRGDLPAAFGRMKSAKEKEPESAQFTHRLGRIAEQLGQLDEALEYLNEAIELDPDLMEAHLSRASVLVDIGELRKAATELDEIEDRLPESQIRVERTIRAKICLAKDELDEGLNMIRRNSDAPSYGIRARIEIRRSQLENQRGYTALAHQALRAAAQHVQEGLARHNGNVGLIDIKKQIDYLLSTK